MDHRVPETRYAKTLDGGYIAYKSLGVGEADVAIVGSIANGFTQVRPAAGPSGAGGALHLRLGSGAARVTVRTFKGTITLARQSP